MIGPSGSGKSTLANRLFTKNEIISSDDVRAELFGDFRIQSNQEDVWEEVRHRINKRLLFGQRVVVDATNLRLKDRQVYIDIANHFQIELVYIVVNRPLVEKLETAGWRNEVPYLIQKHDDAFNSNLKAIMSGDGVATVFDATGNPNDFNPVVIKPADEEAFIANTKKNLSVMVIGDIHGNLVELQDKMMIARECNLYVLFLGDVIDYGTNNLDCFNIVYDLVRKGKASIVWGNHEKKLTKWIESDFGKDFRGIVGSGLAMTVAEITAKLDKDLKFKDRFTAKWHMLYFNSKQHFVFRNHLFTHGAGTKEMWNMSCHTLPGEHSNMAFFGQVDNALPQRADGIPNRIYNWVDDIENGKTVVVGHDPRDKTTPLTVVNKQGGKAIFLDTGSSKGGVLSHIVI